MRAKRIKAPRVPAYQDTTPNHDAQFNPQRIHFSTAEKQHIRRELLRLREQEAQFRQLCRTQY